MRKKGCSLRAKNIIDKKKTKREMERGERIRCDKVKNGQGDREKEREREREREKERERK